MCLASAVSASGRNSAAHSTAGYPQYVIMFFNYHKSTFVETVIGDTKVRTCIARFVELGYIKTGYFNWFLV